MKNLARDIAVGAVGGLGLKVVLDVLFYIMHRTYDPFPGLNSYWPAFAIGAIVAGGFYFFNQKKGKKGPNIYRMWSLLLLTLLILMPLRWILSGLEDLGFIDPETSLFVIPGFINYNHEWIIVFVLILAAFITYLIRLYNYQQKKVRYSLAEIESYKKEQAEYRFGMLQSQVDPHFLFNSLNTLASLVHTDTEAASQFVRRLSGVYRNVLQRSKEDLHPLKEELNLLEDYCGLISIRFKDRVKFNFDIDDSLLEKLIPPLSLQLLIENAVKHNVLSSEEPLEIQVYTDTDKYIHVVNPNRPKRTEGEGSGTGLQNIRNRFKAFSKKDVLVNEGANEFSVSLPLID